MLQGMEKQGNYTFFEVNPKAQSLKCVGLFGRFLLATGMNLWFFRRGHEGSKSHINVRHIVNVGIPTYNCS